MLHRCPIFTSLLFCFSVRNPSSMCSLVLRTFDLAVAARWSRCCSRSIILRSSSTWQFYIESAECTQTFSTSLGTKKKTFTPPTVRAQGSDMYDRESDPSSPNPLSDLARVAWKAVMLFLCLKILQMMLVRFRVGLIDRRVKKRSRVGVSDIPLFFS